MKKIELDYSKLYGFKILQDDSPQALKEVLAQPSLGEALGGKMGNKVGSKVGVKVLVRA